VIIENFNQQKRPAKASNESDMMQPLTNPTTAQPCQCPPLLKAFPEKLFFAKQTQLKLSKTAYAVYS
jgi:hypothetical protein